MSPKKVMIEYKEDEAVIIVFIKYNGNINI